MTRKGASSAAYKVKSRLKIRRLFSRVENSHTCEKQSHLDCPNSNKITVSNPSSFRLLNRLTKPTIEAKREGAIYLQLGPSHVRRLGLQCYDLSLSKSISPRRPNCYRRKNEVLEGQSVRRQRSLCRKL